MVISGNVARIRRNRSIAAVAALTSAAAALVAAAPAAAQQDSVLEEVVVSAQFREEPLQSTPIAISAFTAENLEALRYNVAELIRGGLPREEAVQALTLRVAEALRLEERLGSVESGKDGNLLILSGDPFDVQSEVEKVVLEGTVIYDRDEVTER